MESNSENELKIPWILSLTKTQNHKHKTQTHRYQNILPGKLSSKIRLKIKDPKFYLKFENFPVGSENTKKSHTLNFLISSSLKKEFTPDRFRIWEWIQTSSRMTLTAAAYSTKPMNLDQIDCRLKIACRLTPDRFGSEDGWWHLPERLLLARQSEV